MQGWLWCAHTRVKLFSIARIGHLSTDLSHIGDDRLELCEFPLCLVGTDIQPDKICCRHRRNWISCLCLQLRSLSGLREKQGYEHR